MGVEQRSRHCKNCQRYTRHERPTFDSGMGCLLTVLTGGLFLPIWFFIMLSNNNKPYRCQECGRAKSFLFG